MKKFFLSYLIIGIAAIFFLYIQYFDSTVFSQTIIAPNNTLSLITEPDDGIAPVISLIDNASSSVDLVMYELQDKQVEQALAADEARGVAVRVILSDGYKGASSTANKAAYQYLQANGVPVEYSPSYFALTHEKSLVIDHSHAIIMTFNFTPQYYSMSRDFGLMDNDPNDVQAMESVFDADWQGSKVAAPSGDDLVWSPGSEPALVQLINSAKTSLDIYNEEMADSRVIAALIDAAQRGVAVRIDMTYSSEWKTAFQELTTAGAQVHTYDPKASLYIHAKMIVADDARAFVGSENFSATSLDQNRELGIMIDSSTTITSLLKTFNADWSGATPF